ncbi:MAG: ParA family protein [Bdellovibrionales bacterium]|nr:ParA family protein [Bdellovibrionales bacterium]
MSVLSVINHKGGVAKTTTSINVAANWAAQGKKVLVVDLDPQSSATHAVFGNRDFDTTIYDVLTNRGRISDAIISGENFGFDMIPSELLLSGVDIELAAHYGRERILKRQLDLIRRDYDAIIIDCSPSLGLLTVNALMASQDIIIPICPEYFSIKGIDLILDTLKNIRVGLGHKIGVRGVVITRYRNRKVINDVIEKLSAKYGIHVFDSFIPDNIAVEEAHHNHLPVSKYSPRCKGAQAYCSLSEEIWQ